MSRSSRRPRSDAEAGSLLRLRAVDGILFSELLLAPQLAGVIHLSTWLLVLGASWLALVLLLRSGAPAARLSLWVVAFIALTGLGLLLPLIPLPPSLLDLLSPTAAQTWALGGELSAGRWHPLHQAPGEGRFELIKWLAAALFLAACSLRAAEQRWQSHAVRVVILSGLLASATAVAHRALGADRLFGLYAPHSGNPPMAPLLNENHWAGWLSMCAAFAAGLALSKKSDAPEWRGGLLATAVLAGLVLAGPSRSGILGLACSGLVLGALTLLAAARSRRPIGRSRLLGLGALALFGLVVAAALVLRNSPTRAHPHSGAALGGLDSGHRLSLLHDGWQLALANPWTGTGRGASVDVFPRFQHTPGANLVHWLESLFPQLIVDFGFPLGGAIGALLLAGLLASARNARRDPRRAGAAAALAGLLAHEMADFATFTGAVLLTSAVAVAITLPGRRAAALDRRSAALAVLAPVLLLTTLPYLDHWDAGRCIDRMVEDARDGTGWDVLERREFAHHPASSSVALTVARGHVVDRDPVEALRLLNRSQLLAPRQPYPHILTARLLRMIGAESQALIEYRMAMLGDWDGGAWALFKEVARAYPDVASLERLVPVDQPERAASFALWLYGMGDARASAFAARAAETAPDFPTTPVAVALAVSRTSGGNEAAESILAAWRRPDLPPALRLPLARAMGTAGRTDLQIELLRELVADERSADALSWLLLGAAEVQAGDPAAARAALRNARRGDDPAITSASWYEEARLERGLGRTKRALAAASRAVDTRLPSADSLALAAELQLAAGSERAARDLAQQALARDPDHAGALQFLRSLDRTAPAPAKDPKP